MPFWTLLILIAIGLTVAISWTCADAKQVDYWVEVKHRYRPPKPYCWEICRTDRLQAVQRSPISHRAEAMPKIDGERALRKMLEKLDVRRV
jgi:hypothetical protein